MPRRYRNIGFAALLGIMALVCAAVAPRLAGETVQQDKGEGGK